MRIINTILSCDRVTVHNDGRVTVKGYEKVAGTDDNRRFGMIVIDVLRTLITLLWLVILYVLSLILWPIGFIHQKINPVKAEIWQQKLVCTMLRTILFTCGVRVKYEGLENIPDSDEAFMIAGNHRSIFDIVLTYPIAPKRTAFVAKQGLEKVPLITRWMKRLKCLFIHNGDIKQELKTIINAIDHVKSGVSVCIYPEGRRHKGEDEIDVEPFKEGSFKIATKANARVIPIAISGAREIFEGYRFYPVIHGKKVTVKVGEPIDLKSLSAEQQKHPGEYVRGVVVGMLEEIHNS